MHMFVHLWPVWFPLVGALVCAAGTFLSIRGIRVPERLFAPRRKVHFNVHYDGFLMQHAGRDIKEIGQLAKLVVEHPGGGIVKHPSVVMIRISNDGDLDIKEKDWEKAIEFTFDGRHVEGIEVSDEYKGKELRAQIMAYVAREKEDKNKGKHKDTLQLPKITLQKKDRFRLLVLLSGNRDHPGDKGHGVSGSARLNSGGEKGGLDRETGTGAGARRTSYWAVAGASCIALSILLSFVVKPFTPVNADCVTGTITVDGSTAFGPSMLALAQQYESACPGATINVTPQGSRQGAALLQAAGSSQTTLDMSDGLLEQSTYPNFVPHQVAIVIFSLVVNKDVGIMSLTRSQVREVWSGRYRYWDQISGIPHAPHIQIELVGRTNGSGTRATFDSKVLNGPEPNSTQTSCFGVRLCDEATTDNVLDIVNGTGGAIGYAETAVATQDIKSGIYPDISPIQLDGKSATPQTVGTGPAFYRFWNVEYLYTDGKPAAGGLLQAFITYVTTDVNAASSLMRKDDIPCSSTPLCSQPNAPTTSGTH